VGLSRVSPKQTFRPKLLTRRAICDRPVVTQRPHHPVERSREWQTLDMFGYLDSEGVGVCIDQLAVVRLRAALSRK
jgi:hypothetical protein